MMNLGAKNTGYIQETNQKLNNYKAGGRSKKLCLNAILENMKIRYTFR